MKLRSLAMALLGWLLNLSVGAALVVGVTVLVSILFWLLGPALRSRLSASELIWAKSAILLPLIVLILLHRSPQFDGNRTGE